jgi:hypothetical protein
MPEASDRRVEEVSVAVERPLMPAERGKLWQLNLFAFFVAGISHLLMLRDRLRGVTRRLKRPERGSAFFFESGGRRLAAMLVAAGERSPVVLICHGIAETVEHWSAVQAFLEDAQVGSMVFNYSGYGKSEGTIRAERCDEDFVSAYAELRRRVGAERRVFVLGFSMGSGIAASGVGGLRPAPEGLFLCEAFTTFREATRAAGVPGWLAQFAPDIWDTVAAMRNVNMPVCAVHSDGDGLFPVSMARRIAGAAGERGELVVVRGLGHNEPYLRPTEAYWGAVVERVTRD